MNTSAVQYFSVCTLPAYKQSCVHVHIHVVGSVLSLGRKNLRHDSRAWLGWRLWPHQSLWISTIPTSKGILNCRLVRPTCLRYAGENTEVYLPIPNQRGNHPIINFAQASLIQAKGRASHRFEISSWKSWAAQAFTPTNVITAPYPSSEALLLSTLMKPTQLMKRWGPKEHCITS